MEEGKNFPDIYFLSKFTSLPLELKKYLPETVNVIEVDFSGLELNTQEPVELPNEVTLQMRNAEIVLTDTTCVISLLYKLPMVKWIQSTRVGVEIVIGKLNRSKPLPQFKLTRYVDSRLGDLMANYVISQIINMERKLFFYHDMQKAKIWDRPGFLPNVRSLNDLTIGLLGAGKIGKAVGKLLKKCGCRVIVLVRNTRDGSSESFDRAVTDLHEILYECDYICNALPSTEKTRGLLDNDVLKNCKKKPVFMNIGRGDVIKNATIVKALRNSWISQAILDVFEEEPLPPDDPLWSMPEVHITPHIGAFPETEQMAKFIANNYMKYVNGENLMNVVDWENGY